MLSSGFSEIYWVYWSDKFSAPYSWCTMGSNVASLHGDYVKVRYENWWYRESRQGRARIGTKLHRRQFPASHLSPTLGIWPRMSASSSRNARSMRSIPVRDTSTRAGSNGTRGTTPGWHYSKVPGMCARHRDKLQSTSLSTSIVTVPPLR